MADFSLSDTARFLAYKLCTFYGPVAVCTLHTSINQAHWKFKDHKALVVSTLALFQRLWKRGRHTCSHTELRIQLDTVYNKMGYSFSCTNCKMVGKCAELVCVVLTDAYITISNKSCIYLLYLLLTWLNTCIVSRCTIVFADQNRALHLQWYVLDMKWSGHIHRHPQSKV